MAFDALSLSVLVKELREKILGAKINKIFQPEKDELHFLLFNNGNFRLVMSANASVGRFSFYFKRKGRTEASAPLRKCFPSAHLSDREQQAKSDDCAEFLYAAAQAYRRRNDLRRQAAAF